MEKAATRKNGRAPMAQKKKPQSSAPAHPPYFQMIKEAILALHERTGSSAYAIAKYMEEKHKGKLPENFRKLLAVQLRNSTAKGKLIKVKASFKLSPSDKQEAKKVTKNVKSKAADGKKTTEAVKPNKQKIASGSARAKRKAAVTPKKPAALAKGVKKARAVKAAAPVKPKRKSIKAPVAKKAKKAAA